jgi:hypothetical protein
MQIWKDSKYAFQEKQGRGKAIQKISRLYRVFSIEGFPKASLLDEILFRRLLTEAGKFFDMDGGGYSDCLMKGLNIPESRSKVTSKKSKILWLTSRVFLRL